MNYLLADGRQPVEAVTGRFEANDALARAAEAGVAHAHRGAPRGLVVARAARGERGARRRHEQRHVGRAALLHAATVPTLSPKPAVLGRLQVLTFQHGALVGRRRLQQRDRRVLHRCALSSARFADYGRLRYAT